MVEGGVVDGDSQLVTRGTRRAGQLFEESKFPKLDASSSATANKSFHHTYVHGIIVCLHRSGAGEACEERPFPLHVQTDDAVGR